MRRTARCRSGPASPWWTPTRAPGGCCGRCVTSWRCASTLLTTGAEPSGQLLDQPGVDVVEEPADGDRVRDQRVRADRAHVVAQRRHLVLDDAEVLPGRVLARRLADLGPH